MNTDAVDLRDFASAVPGDFRTLLQGREAEAGVAGERWLSDLPRLVRECADQWSLRATGAVRHGMAAVVIPCLRDGEPVVLKVTWPHPEAEHEHLALRAWDGDGAVRLLAADPSRLAMLLEPLDAQRDLSAVDVDESCRVIGELLGRLDRTALPQLVRLSQESTRWVEQLRTDGPQVLPRRIVARAVAVCEQLGTEADVDARLVHSDLHDANVLSADRSPWLAIDPKPVAGVPELAIAPLVWNRHAEAAAVSSTRAHLRRRVEIACAAGGFDVDRALLWTLVRCALNAAWESQCTEPDAEWISWMVTICKAMQD